MDFTEIYKQSGNLASFSPGAHFILNVVENTLIVRRTDTLQIARTWTVTAPSSTASILTNSKSTPSSLDVSSEGWISHAGWSCDSEYLFAASAKKGIVEVFKLRDENWNARIEAGVEGLLKAEWAPDGRHILCFSQWGLRVTIWSLVTGNATYIQFPIHPDRGYAFRSDSRYFVLAERHRSKDAIGVYDTTDGYKLVRHFPVPTSNLSSLALSPTGNHIAIWEGILEYKLHILSLAGDVQGTFSPKPNPGFGVRNAAWHPTGMFLAVAGWDDKGLTWSVAATLELSSKIPVGATLWREPSNWLETTQGRGFLSYERLQGPQTISLQRTDPTKSNPKSGAVQLEWNKTGTLLLVRFENCPTVVHLYDFPASSDPFVPRLRCVFQHSKSVLHAQWNPVRKGSLALCSGSGSIYTWSDEWIGENGVEEDMAECIGVPANTKFDTRGIKWAPDGKGLVLLDKEVFCCAFEVEEDGTES
ncbi:quinon protein alcohol dehydrogenase-like superfamily [Suillus subaureus]|uniref:Quinon protein alcohol dehydrogenase-like superfamily n=1 Tax=Suillus subaureus TaxID=48587 RepID=A0A9P7JJF0_9AGAM|nr:quinon protein alcohol dehydrogenase-like superfamily [Suillus subaureus]KAG1825806.1 quinon protein alcohol dehydrogenase-like superfamily [Suillus subaureus]